MRLLQMALQGFTYDMPEINEKTVRAILTNLIKWYFPTFVFQGVCLLSCKLYQADWSKTVPYPNKQKNLSPGNPDPFFRMWVIQNRKTLIRVIRIWVFQIWFFRIWLNRKGLFWFYRFILECFKSLCSGIGRRYFAISAKKLQRWAR